MRPKLTRSPIYVLTLVAGLLVTLAGLRLPKVPGLPDWNTPGKSIDELGLPLIVKPSCEGSSVGISRVLDDAGLDDAVSLASNYPGELLMEQMVVGDELTVAIIANGDGHAALERSF